MKKSVTKVVKATVAVAMMIGAGVGAGLSSNQEVNPVYATPIQAFSFSRSASTNTVTNGYSMVLTNYKGNADNYQDKNSDVGLDIGVKKTSGTIWTTAPESISLTVKVGGGNTKDPLSNNVLANLIDTSGTAIAGTSVTVTTKVETASGKNYTISVPSAANAAGVMVHHTKESGYNVRVYEISLSYESSGSVYTVSFNSNGGSSVDSVNVLDGGCINPLPQPTKTKDSANQKRFEFEGWYTNEGLTGDKFTTSTPVTSSFTLYAKYTSISYSVVNFNSNGGSSVGSIEVDNGGTISKPNNPTKRCYSFVGWFTTPGCTDGSEFTFDSDTISSNTTLYAKWADSVTPISENGVFVEVVDNEGLVNGAKYLITYNGEKAFDGALENLDVSSNTVDIEFDDEYIVKDSNTSTAYFTLDTTNGYILSASGKYIGIGSYNNGMLTRTTPNASYENNFAFDNGDFVVSRQIDEGKIMYLQYNSGAGQCRFRYFKDGAQQSIQLYRFAQAFTVSFVTNGGSSIADKSVPDGCTLTLPANPTKSPDATYSYTFEGWYTNEGLTSAFDDATPITGNLTLYAKYTRELIDNPFDYLCQGETIATLSATETIATEETKSVTFSNGLSNGETIDDNPVAIGRVTLTGAKATGNNTPAYYSSDSTLRAYTSNTLTFSSPYTISRIEITFLSSSYAKNYSTNGGEFEIDGATGTWEGSASTVVLTASANNRMTSISVTYSGDITNVDSVALRFGMTIAKDRWNSVASNWTISDYGVMIVKKSTLEGTYSLNSVEEAYEASQPLAILHSGNGDTPYEKGDNYLFTVKLNMSNSISYRIVYRAAPFVVVNGTYYFLDEIECSVNSIASDYLASGDSGLSNSVLNILAGN